MHTPRAASPNGCPAKRVPLAAKSRHCSMQQLATWRMFHVLSHGENAKQNKLSLQLHAAWPRQAPRPQKTYAKQVAMTMPDRHRLQRPGKGLRRRGQHLVCGAKRLLGTVCQTVVLRTSGAFSADLPFGHVRCALSAVACID